MSSNAAEGSKINVQSKRLEAFKAIVAYAAPHRLTFLAIFFSVLYLQLRRI